MNELIIVITKDNKVIKLNYVQQENGSWISMMENETMQDIKHFYPEVLDERAN
jgi:hypothetical protein